MASGSLLLLLRINYDTIPPPTTQPTIPPNTPSTKPTTTTTTTQSETRTTTTNPERTTNSNNIDHSKTFDTTNKPTMTTRSISGSDTTTHESSTTTIVIGSLVGVVVLLKIVIVLVIVCCLKKREGEVNKNKAPIRFHANNPAFKASTQSQQQHNNYEYQYPEVGPASNVHQNQQPRTTVYEFDPGDEENSQYQPYLKPVTSLYETIPYND
ncbi:uncharacterized protein [Clytia hemisphaerica]|uniref:uncharacterized protein n=1 Tax=Clytia hemisphaerica TaxID=252671 RepID=UPI0034D7808E